MTLHRTATILVIWSYCCEERQHLLLSPLKPTYIDLNRDPKRDKRSKSCRPSRRSVLNYENGHAPCVSYIFSRCSPDASPNATAAWAASCGRRGYCQFLLHVFAFGVPKGLIKIGVRALEARKPRKSFRFCVGLVRHFYPAALLLLLE